MLLGNIYALLVHFLLPLLVHCSLKRGKRQAKETKSVLGMFQQPISARAHCPPLPAWAPCGRQMPARSVTCASEHQQLTFKTFHVLQLFIL